MNDEVIEVIEDSEEIVTCVEIKERHIWRLNNVNAKFMQFKSGMGLLELFALIDKDYYSISSIDIPKEKFDKDSDIKTILHFDESKLEWDFDNIGIMLCILNDNTLCVYIKDTLKKIYMSESIYIEDYDAIERYNNSESFVRNMRVFAKLFDNVKFITKPFIISHDEFGEINDFEVGIYYSTCTNYISKATVDIIVDEETRFAKYKAYSDNNELDFVIFNNFEKFLHSYSKLFAISYALNAIRNYKLPIEVAYTNNPLLGMIEVGLNSDNQVYINFDKHLLNFADCRGLFFKCMDHHAYPFFEDCNVKSFEKLITKLFRHMRDKTDDALSFEIYDGDCRILYVEGLR